MANYMPGPLALPETDEPLANSMQPTPQQIQARQAGALPMGGQPPGGAPQQPGFQGFNAPGGQQRINQIYGLLAQYGDDPSRIGQGYVQAIQQQQRLSRENQPLERYAQLYGNINPHDFTADSLANFHDNLVKTGQINYRLLDRRELLTDKETQMIADADHESQNLSLQMMRAQEAALKFDDMARRGVSGGVRADVRRWLNEKLGREGNDALVYREFDDLKNSSVIGNLPPGVASDRDIEIAMRGWPPATASPAHVASFLRGRQKMMAVQHAAKAHESYFLSKHRTRAGLAADWNKKAEFYARDALERFGGVYEPLGPDGQPLDADQAAEYRFRQPPSTNPEARAAGAPPVRPAVPSAPRRSTQEMSDEEIDALYGVN